MRKVLQAIALSVKESGVQNNSNETPEIRTESNTSVPNNFIPDSAGPVDSEIDEHFRRSLGADYQQLFKNTRPQPQLNTDSGTFEKKKIYQKKHIKQPLNAYKLWNNKRRPEIIQANPDKNYDRNVIEISKIIATEWKAMTEAEKMPFIDEAKKLRDEHKRKYPDYKYSFHKKTKKVNIQEAKGCTNYIPYPTIPMVDPLQSLESGHASDDEINPFTYNLKKVYRCLFLNKRPRNNTLTFSLIYLWCSLASTRASS